MTPEELDLDPTSVLPVPKKPFLPGAGVSIRRLGRSETKPGLPTLYVFGDVTEELLFASTFQPTQALAGYLTGGYYQGAAGRYIEVRGFHQSTVVDSSLEMARRLKQEWLALHKDPALSEAGLIPVGWFYSRAGSGARPGPFELIVHLTYFNRPYHVLWLLDPAQRLTGLYQQWPDGELCNVAFNLIEAQPRSATSEAMSHGDPPSTGA
jgi:hypothetical protein